MKGVITKISDQWIVKYEKDDDTKYLEIHEKTTEILKKPEYQNLLEEGSEVDIDFMVVGEICEDKKFIKKTFAKIKKINNSVLN